jgi:hypothetical protein
MDNQDYQQMQKLKTLAGEVPLKGLLAIFTKQLCDEVALVYTQAQGGTTNQNHRVILLDRISDVDLDEYDGYVAGLPELELVRGDLLPRGSRFRRLVDLLPGREKQLELHESQLQLAHHLLGLLNASDDDSPLRLRIERRIIGLVLPSFFDEWPPENLVAVLPNKDLNSFIERGGGWLDARGSLDPLLDIGEEDWIVSFEDLGILSPFINAGNKRFIELRPIVRRSGYGHLLPQTCRTLAETLYASNTHPESRTVAWELMTEAWLAQDDPNDLVAFAPIGDFPTFAMKGEALRVYRNLVNDPPSGLPGIYRSLEQVYQGDTGGVHRGYTLLPLPEQQESGEPRERLGLILWRAGHDNALAETMALLARDAVEKSGASSYLPPSKVTDLALRAYWLLALSNPWTWRNGRLTQFLEKTGEVLREALRGEASSLPPNMSISQRYYRALADWLHCATRSGEGVEACLRDLRGRAISLVEHAREIPSGYLSNAQALIQLADAALYQTVYDESGAVQTTQSAHLSEVGWVRRKAAEPLGVEDHLSPLFRQERETILQFRYEFRQTLRLERNPVNLRRRLAELRAQAERQRRRLFTLPHEQAVLIYAYQQEIHELEKYRREAEISLRVEAHNTHLDYGVESDAIFHVQNMGEDEVFNIDLVLERNDTFELADSDKLPVRFFDNLKPGSITEPPFSFRVKAVVEPEVVFPFRLNFARKKEEQAHLIRTQDIRLPTTRRSAVRLVQGNPYHVGPPIQSPKSFYGRRNEIRSILAGLNAGSTTSWLIVAPRRLGKTSILNMLYAAIKDPATRDRFDIPANWSAALDNYQPIQLSLQNLSFDAGGSLTRQFFGWLLDRVATAIDPSATETLVAAYHNQPEHLPPASVVLELLKRLFERNPQKRGLVLLDEYDEIYRPLLKELPANLRSVVIQEQHLTWVVTSTLMIYKEAQSYGSPWFNALQHLKLGPLNEVDAERLIDEPSREVGVHWQSDAMVLLRRETGRHPFYIQLFCSHVIQHLMERNSDYVVPGLLADLMEEVIDERHVMHEHFHQYWTDPDTPVLGRLIVLAVDAADSPLLREEIRDQVWKWVKARTNASTPTGMLNPVFLAWFDKEFVKGMDWMVDVIGVLGRDDTRKTYSFSVPLFRRWLQRRYGSQRNESLVDEAIFAVIQALERDGIS